MESPHHCCLSHNPGGAADKCFICVFALLFFLRSRASTSKSYQVHLKPSSDPVSVSAVNSYAVSQVCGIIGVKWREGVKNHERVSISAYEKKKIYIYIYIFVSTEDIIFFCPSLCVFLIIRISHKPFERLQANLEDLWAMIQGTICYL